MSQHAAPALGRPQAPGLPLVSVSTRRLYRAGLKLPPTCSPHHRRPSIISSGMHVYIYGVQAVPNRDRQSGQQSCLRGRAWPAQVLMRRQAWSFTSIWSLKASAHTSMGEHCPGHAGVCGYALLCLRANPPPPCAKNAYRVLQSTLPHPHTHTSNVVRSLYTGLINYTHPAKVHMQPGPTRRHSLLADVKHGAWTLQHSA